MTRSRVVSSLVMCLVLTALCFTGVHMAHASTLTHLSGPLLLGAALDTVTLPTFDKIEDVPEAFRPAYEVKNGKVVPIVEDARGLKGKNQDLLTKLSKAQERAALLGERTPEEIQADFDLATETRKKAERGSADVEDLRTKMSAEHKKEMDKITKKATRYSEKLYDVTARQVATEAITTAGGNPKVLLPHVLPFIKSFETDEDIGVRVVDAKGNPRIADAAGTEMTIAQLVETFKADENFGVAFKTDGATGGGARGGGGSGDGVAGGVTISAADAKDVAKYRQARAKAEKLGVPLRVLEG